MKKSLVALAALAATGAFGQSSVTLSGTFDLSVQNAKNDVTSATTMAKNGMASSRIQFAGTEDMGKGMKANFICDTTLTPNAGLGYTSGASASSASNTAATATASLCDRTGLVGVAGGFGRVDLGGDYTPMFRLTGVADPFGTNGVASWYNLAGTIARGSITGLTTASIGADYTSTVASGTSASYLNPFYGSATATVATGVQAHRTVGSVNATRANNTVIYTSPTFNGISFSAMHIVDGVAGSNTTGKQGAGHSVRVRYDAGPLTLAVGQQSIKHSTSTTTVADIDSMLLVGSYDLGMAKVTFGYQTQEFVSLKGTDTILGLVVPMGAGTIKASYATKSVDTADNSGAFGAKQLGLAYIYALSKRTDVYAQYGRIKNDADSSYGVLTPTAGASSTAYQFGVRHAF